MRLVSGNFYAAAGKFYQEVQSGLSEAWRSSSSRRRKERKSFKRMFTPAGQPLTGAKPLASRELSS